MNNEFQNPEDKAFFDELFCDFGGYEENKANFDFRDPKDKRSEFNQLRNQIFKKLTSIRGSRCELGIHEKCTGIAEEVDHMIPLSSNVLNKNLRGMKAKAGKKVTTQSFGSNDPRNLILACRKCNAFKKHKFLDRKSIAAIKRAWPNNRPETNPACAASSAAKP